MLTAQTLCTMPDPALDAYAKAKLTRLMDAAIALTAAAIAGRTAPELTLEFLQATDAWTAEAHSLHPRTIHTVLLAAQEILLLARR
jgi:hypothetical protein